MNTVIDSKLLLLNSKNGLIYNNDSFKSDIIFKLPATLRMMKDIKELRYHMLDATIPVSFYNINYTNNKLYYVILATTYEIVVPVGNYNFNSLSARLILDFAGNGHLFDVLINKQNGIIQFYHTDNEYYLLNKAGGSTMLEVLGFIETDNQYSVSDSIYPTYPLNLLGIQKLKIYSTALSSSNIDVSKQGMSNLIGLIPVDQPSFGLIVHENKNQTKFKVRNDIIDEIDIQIYDENGNLVNFNNIDWTITLLVELTLEEPEISKDTLEIILKKQKEILKQQLEIPEIPPPAQLIQPISDIQTDDLEYFIYTNPNLIL